MFTYQGTITDAYGIQHTNPVFAIEYCNSQANTGANISYNYQDDEVSEDSYQNFNANYSMIFWTNQAAKDGGSIPLNFVKTHQRSDNNYYFNPTELLSSKEEVLLACEEHFLTEILPEFIVE